MCSHPSLLGGGFSLADDGLAVPRGLGGGGECRVYAGALGGGQALGAGRHTWDWLGRWSAHAHVAVLGRPVVQVLRGNTQLQNCLRIIWGRDSYVRMSMIMMGRLKVSE